MKTYVFVYGTLKTGGGNHHLLHSSTSLGLATTTEDTFTMYDGGFPYVIDEGFFKIRGELFEVTNPITLENLDRLEGVPSHFCRRDVEVKTDDGEVHEAFMYVAGQSTKAYLLETERRRLITVPNDNNECWW